MLKKWEKYRIYKAIVELMEHEEAYNKSKSIISASEFYDLCKKRYLLMQEILEPLKRVLSNEFMITNIYFAKSVQDDVAIVIEYREDDTKKFFVLSRYDCEEIQIILDNGFAIKKDIIGNNDGLIKKVFNDGCAHQFEQEFIVPSTTGMFKLLNDGEIFSLKDSLDGDSLSLLFNYGNSDNIKEVKSNYKNIIKYLESDENIHNYLENIKVYEENVPKCLIKTR